MAEQTGYGRLKTSDFTATNAIDSDTLVADVYGANQRAGMSFKTLATVAGTAQLYWVDGFGASHSEGAAETVTANETLTQVARSYWPKRFIRFTPGAQPGSVIIEGAAF